MKKNIKQTKSLFKEASIKTMKDFGVDDKIKEAALPAYAHKNPLIDYLFWKRLYVVYNYINKINCKNVLDFGCGSGVMSYLMEKSGKSVVGVDIEYEPLNKIKKYIKFPDDILFIDPEKLKNSKYNRYFDVIIALDVLEHIEDLESVIKLFKNLLKDGGFVIVSGPTENILYKIGRRIAGRDFKGDYHVSNIQNIKEEFSNFSDDIKAIAKLYPLFPLFDVFIVKL
jgi:2-polyprenyl-3-methyl-5-hydroxy-6-metoxy-1,4-benzoquinol methylase